VALFFSLTGAGLAAQHDLSATASGVTSMVYGPVVALCPKASHARTCNIGVSAATCPTGTSVTGGGWDLLARGRNRFPAHGTITANSPINATTWGVAMVNGDTVPAGFEAVAICSR
jgi:hypothetical protein